MKKEAVPNVCLRQARYQRNWTQRRLADELGVEEQTVRSWERGTRVPSLDMRHRLCQLFETTPEQLGLQPPGRELPASPESSALASFSDEAGYLSQPRFRESHHENACSLADSLSSPVIKPRDDNRHRMVQHVRSRWITGVLEDSLSPGMLITLGLQEQPDAVVNPWHYVVQETALPPRPLPVGTRITQVYDDAGGELLILGEPGAGKTTLLLVLARELLERAEDDETVPIPVIFTLSSWAERPSSLTIWLIEEFHRKYQVPRQLAEAWILADRILPLLDDLDEVSETQRPACIEAINHYRQTHGLLPLVICSRSHDYLAHQERVLLRTAVVVQPLTSTQIDAYLASIGESLHALRETICIDPRLQELASTPLFLAMLARMPHDLSTPDVAAPHGFTLPHQAVFERYVERVLQHRRASTRYNAQQTKRWLAWLARHMTQRGQTEFYLERIQPDCLTDHQRQHRYQNTVKRLVYGIECFVVAALFTWIRGGQVGTTFGVGVGLLGQLGGGQENSVLGWMAPGLGGGLQGGGSLGIIIAIMAVLLMLLLSTPCSSLTVRALWHGLSKGVRQGLFVGVAVGLFSTLVFGWSDGLRNGFIRGLGAGLFAGLLTTLSTGLLTALRSHRPSSYTPAAESKKKDTHMRKERSAWRERCIDVAVFSLCASIGAGTVQVALVGLNQDIFLYVPIAGLFLGLAFGLAGGTALLPGLGQTITPTETATWSWRSVGQHLGEHLRQGLLIGLAVGMLMIVTLACISGCFYVSYGARYGVVYGLIIGVLKVNYLGPSPK